MALMLKSQIKAELEINFINLQFSKNEITKHATQSHIVNKTTKTIYVLE